MQAWDKCFNYYMQDWLPLNQKNYHVFKSLNSEIEQKEFLEKILRGNILSFAKGINWTVENEIKVRINEIIRKKIIKVKGVPRETFTLTFSSNVFLPNHIGLGKNASMGFGVIQEIKNRKKFS
jgi:CRISPR/Cas system endoribonuclease Cas6 (RAMP superfamily)